MSHSVCFGARLEPFHVKFTTSTWCTEVSAGSKSIALSALNPVSCCSCWFLHSTLPFKFSSVLYKLELFSFGFLNQSILLGSEYLIIVKLYCMYKINRVCIASTKEILHIYAKLEHTYIRYVNIRCLMYRQNLRCTHHVWLTQAHPNYTYIGNGLTSVG